MSTPTMTFTPRKVHAIDTDSGLTDVVKRVEWGISFVSGDHESIAGGVTILPEPLPEDYIPISEVNDNIIKNWVVKTHGSSFIDDLEEFHQQQLNDKVILESAKNVSSLETPRPVDPFLNVEKNTISSLPLLDNTAVSLLLDTKIKNLTLNKIHDKTARLVAVEMLFPTEHIDEQSNNMFDSVKKIVDLSYLLGITTILKTNDPTIMNYFETTYIFDKTEIQKDFYLYTQPLSDKTGKKIVYTSLEFMGLFTETEEQDILTACDTDTNVRKFYNQLLSANFVNKADSRVEYGINYLVEIGALNQIRANEIMSI